MIRLSRVGKKKKAEYRLAVQDKQTDPWGKTLELVGHYNPHTKQLTAKAERIKHWLGQGAKMSATINNLLVEHKIIEGQKVKAAKRNLKPKPDQAKDKAGAAKPAESAAGPTPTEPKTEPVPAEPKAEAPVEEKK